MSPDLAARLLSGTALVVLIAALWWLYRLHQQLRTLESTIDACAELGRSQAGRIDALENLRDTQQITEQAVETGTAVVREVHKGIANVPFSILESIPTTRESAKVVRQIHDAVSDSVYGAISGLNKAVGRELRKAIPLDQSRESPPATDNAPRAAPASPPSPQPPSPPKKLG